MPPWTLLSSVGSTILSAFGQNKAGQAQSGAYKIYAMEDRQNAQQASAAAQQQALEVQRQANIVASRAQAVAASSGGGATDPSVLNTIANIHKWGTYNSLNALYQGAATARAYNVRADSEDYMAKQARTSGKLNAIDTILGNAGTIAKGFL